VEINTFQKKASSWGGGKYALFQEKRTLASQVILRFAYERKSRMRKEITNPIR
jgi:hypothetical protein